jgi:hypothetical protein
MDRSEFLEGLPEGVKVPTLLLKLADYESMIGDKEQYSGYFCLTDEGQQTAYAWFHGDEEAASKFVIFGTNDGDDSSYAFWLYKGQDVAKAPIVFLSSEGSVSLLADSVEEFLALLSCGVPELGHAAPLEYVEEETEGLKKFRAWLKKECGIGKPEDPTAIVLKAMESHPNLQEWIEEWQESGSEE